MVNYVNQWISTLKWKLKLIFKVMRFFFYILFYFRYNTKLKYRYSLKIIKEFVFYHCMTDLKTGIIIVSIIPSHFMCNLIKALLS